MKWVNAFMRGKEFIRDFNHGGKRDIKEEMFYRSYLSDPFLKGCCSE